MNVNKLLHSFRYAFAGLVYLFRTQRNGRIHLLAMITVTFLGIYFKLTFLEWSIITICIGLVFAAELFNTAIEATIDLITLEQHPLAKTAKDTAAAGVLVLAITSLFVALFIFGPHFIFFLHYQS